MSYRYFLGLGDFPPRWYCGSWSDLLGWTHILSDLSIWAAYFTIPFVLLHFARKRREFPFSKVLLVFALFILSCGTVHFLEAVIFWYPVYRVSAVLKVFTAIVSWLAVYVLYIITPKFLQYPDPEDLRREVVARIETQKELERTSVRLEHSNQALRAFVRTASHDLKSPLRAMRNLAGFVEEDAGHLLEPANLAHLEKIQTRASDLEDLLEKLLAYSQLDRAERPTVEVNCKQLVKHIFELNSSKEKSALEIEGELPVLRTDEVLLSTVIRNLISNSVKHHPTQEPTVRVWAEEREDHFLFHFSDNGEGISREHQDQIFEIFKKFGKERSDGVGLALVQKSLAEVGGQIWVESKPGEGATFTFLWPKKMPE